MTRRAMLVGLLLLVLGFSGCAPDLRALADDRATLCLSFNGWGSTIEIMRSNPDTNTDVSVTCNRASITAPGVIHVPLRVVPVTPSN